MGCGWSRPLTDDKEIKYVVLIKEFCKSYIVVKDINIRIKNALDRVYNIYIIGAIAFGKGL